MRAPVPVKSANSYPARRLYEMILGWGTVALVYFGVGWFDVDPVIIPPVWLDHQLEFSEAAIWGYLSFFILIPYTYYSVPAGSLLHLRHAMQISAVVSGLFFVAWPSSIIYPESTQSGVSEALLKFLITMDSPNNCFPSLHASLTTLCVLISLQRQRALRSIGFLLLGVWILASIIMLRRHLTIDVSAGVVLGVLSYFLADFIRCRKT